MTEAQPAARVIDNLGGVVVASIAGTAPATNRNGSRPGERAQRLRARHTRSGSERRDGNDSQYSADALTERPDAQAPLAYPSGMLRGRRRRRGQTDALAVELVNDADGGRFRYAVQQGSDDQRTGRWVATLGRW